MWRWRARVRALRLELRPTSSEGTARRGAILPRAHGGHLARTQARVAHVAVQHLGIRGRPGQAQGRAVGHLGRHRHRAGRVDGGEASRRFRKRYEAEDAGYTHCP